MAQERNYDHSCHACYKSLWEIWLQFVLYCCWSFGRLGGGGGGRDQSTKVQSANGETKYSTQPKYCTRQQRNNGTNQSEDSTLTFMLLSLEPLTRRFPSRCRHRTVPLWPTSVCTDHWAFVRIFHTCAHKGCKSQSQTYCSSPAHRLHNSLWRYTVVLLSVTLQVVQKKKKNKGIHMEVKLSQLFMLRAYRYHITHILRFIT